MTVVDDVAALSSAKSQASSAEVGQTDALWQLLEASNQLALRVNESHRQLESEVVRLRKQLASTDAELQRSKRLAALGEMAAGIAHEIRNPLGAIRLYASMIAEDLTGHATLTEAFGNAEKITTAVVQLDAIVRDVLLFARDLQPTFQSVTMGEVVGQTAALVEARLQAQGVILDCDVSQSEAVVHVDGALLRQALANLVNNAIDALTEHDVAESKCVRLTSRLVEGEWQIVVADNGPGIDTAGMDRLFNPFFTTRDSGTGLGLSIVHRIVEAHAGKVRVHNDKGAVFTLLLPIDRSKQK